MEGAIEGTHRRRTQLHRARVASQMAGGESWGGENKTRMVRSREQGFHGAPRLAQELNYLLN